MQRIPYDTPEPGHFEGDLVLNVMKTIQKIQIDDFHYWRVIDHEQLPFDRVANADILADTHIESKINSVTLLFLSHFVKDLRPIFTNSRVLEHLRLPSLFNSLTQLRKDKDSPLVKFTTVLTGIKQ